VAHPQIAVFARLADGNAKPSRTISGQKSLVARTTHGVAYDDIRDVFMVTQFYAQAILVFRGGANGEEAPIRIIQGPKTLLKAPDRLTLDPVHNEIYVPQQDKVLVFNGDAQGDVAPIRVLQGPDTDLRAGNVAIDAVNNLMVVGGMKGRNDGQLQIFDRTANGNVKPKRTIRGPHSQLNFIFGPFQIYPPKGEIIVPIRGYGELASDDCFVGVWDEFANGDVPPRWRIGGPQRILQQVRGVALIPKEKSIIVTDKRVNAVMTFYFPEIF
jgi:hypothetical protein